MKPFRWALAAVLVAGFAVSAQLAMPSDASAWPCGSYTRHVPWGADEVWYNHCGPHRICIKVDERFNADSRRELAGWANIKLGTTGYIRGAWYIGLPHPTLRCSIY